MLRPYRSPGIGRAQHFGRERHGSTCCLNARGYDHPDADVGHIREPDCCGPSRRVLVRRAVPDAGRGRRAGVGPWNRTKGRARRRPGGDGGRSGEPVVALEGALRPHARPRARAHRGSAAHRRGDRATPSPGRRARRHARRADRGDAAPGRGERQRKRPRGHQRCDRRGRGRRRRRRRLRRGLHRRRAASRRTSSPRIRERCAAIASVTRPRRARRSLPPASSRLRGTSAS